MRVNQPKKLHNKEHTMKKMLSGMKQVYDKVSITTGALGSWIVIENEIGLPKIINDGVNTSKEIWLEDPLENMGAQLMISSADNTAKVVGDNTSLTSILTYKFSEGGYNALESNPKYRARHLTNGMAYQVNEVIKELAKIRKPMQNEQGLVNWQELFNVAHIACRDEVVSNLIVQAIEKAGPDGVIHIIQSHKDEDYLEFAEGMKIDRGYIIPQLCTNQKTMSSRLANPYVILVNDNLVHDAHIIDILNQILEDVKTSNDVLIIANDFSDKVRSFLIKSHKRTSLNIQCFDTPGISDNDKLEYLLDIQSIVGGEIFQVFGGMKIENAKIEQLGDLDDANITKNHSTLYKEKEKVVAQRVNDRVEHLKEVLEEEHLSPIKKAIIKERIARLTSGVALIRIYEPTSEALEDKWERTEDALRSAKSALLEGILPGGAISLRDVAKSLRESVIRFDDDKPEEFTKGRDIVLTALYEPSIQILENAEYNVDEIGKFLEMEKGIGINVFTGEVGNLMDKGVIDTFLGARISLLNALSSSTMFLKVGGSIVTKRDDEDV